MVLLIFLNILLFVSTAKSETSLKTLETDEIVGDVIDKLPTEPIEIIYPVERKRVEFGTELTPTQVKNPPTLTWKSEQSAFYTLAMVDPDAPSRATPNLREVNHWLVVNIKGSNVTTGEVIAEYLGSGPPKSTGLHRYTFLVFKQQDKIVFDEAYISSQSRTKRLKFSIRKFAKKYNMGDPIAANYFKAQWDPYVEIRNKNLKD